MLFRFLDNHLSDDNAECMMYMVMKIMGDDDVVMKMMM